MIGACLARTASGSELNKPDIGHTSVVDPDLQRPESFSLFRNYCFDLDPVQVKIATVPKLFFLIGKNCSII